MPATYTHYRFGKQLLPQLPADVRQCIQRFRRMFDTGLQGPDLFFYYNPFAKTAVGDLGHLFHMQSGQEFFTRACAQADSEAATAYLYGLLAHYCLDSVCHPFVDQMVNIGEAKHIALESELERFYMAKDGIREPHTHDRSKYVHLTRGECMTAASFFSPATGSYISQCVKIYGMCLRFLGSPKRSRNENLTRRFAPTHLEHFIPTEEVEDYHYMIGELQLLYTQALERYPILLEQLQLHRKTGEPLGSDFVPNFG